MTSRIDLRDASLLDFVPESIVSDPEIIALSLAIDPELREVGIAIIEATILPRIADVSPAVLEELGWAFRLNELQLWDVATTDAKRNLLVNIFAIRKKSGTRFAVRRVFDLVSVVGEVIEWWEEAAPPYTYRLRLFVDDVGVTLLQMTQISEVTHRFAPARASLTEFAVESDRETPLRIYPVHTVGRHVTIPFGGP